MELIYLGHIAIIKRLYVSAIQSSNGRPEFFILLQSNKPMIYSSKYRNSDEIFVTFKVL